MGNQGMTVWICPEVFPNRCGAGLGLAGTACTRRAVSSRRWARLRGMGDEAGPSAVVVLRREDGDVLLGPVYAATGCQVALLDDLLRVHLAARRFGWCIRLRAVRQDLRELLDLAGLTAELEG